MGVGIPVLKQGHMGVRIPFLKQGHMGVRIPFLKQGHMGVRIPFLKQENRRLSPQPAFLSDLFTYTILPTAHGAYTLRPPGNAIRPMPHGPRAHDPRPYHTALTPQVYSPQLPCHTAKAPWASSPPTNGLRRAYRQPAVHCPYNPTTGWAPSRSSRFV